MAKNKKEITQNAGTGEGEMLAQNHETPGLPGGDGETVRQAGSEASPTIDAGKEKKKRSSGPRTPKKGVKRDTRVAESKESPKVAGGDGINLDQVLPLYTSLGNTISALRSLGMTGDQIMTGAKGFCRQ